MEEPHSGQREPGDTIETPAGIRVMQTFKKLPINKPKRKKAAMITFLLGYRRGAVSMGGGVSGVRCITRSRFFVGGEGGAIEKKERYELFGEENGALRAPPMDDRR